MLRSVGTLVFGLLALAGLIMVASLPAWLGLGMAGSVVAAIGGAIGAVGLVIAAAVLALSGLDRLV